MKNIKRRYLIASFLLLSSLILIIVLAIQFTVKKEKIKVSLKWLNQAQFVGMYLADNDGIYSRSGLSVEFEELDPSQDRIQDLVNGEVDFAVLSAEELITAVDEGHDIKAVAAIYQISPYALVSLSDAQINSPADFVGKKLGIKAGKLEEKLFYLSLLSVVGLDESAGEFVTLGFDKKELDNLTDSDADIVDLYRTDQLYYFEKQNLDYEIIYPEQYGINIYNDVLVTTNQLINENPKIVDKFVSATIQGWEKVSEDIERSVDVSMKYTTDNSYKDQEYQRYIIESSLPLIKPNPSSRIGSMTFSNWNKLYLQLKQNNLIVGDFEVGDLFTTDFLP